MRIAVVALGKIWLPLAVQFASSGHDVIGVAVNQKAVDSVPKTGLADLEITRGLADRVSLGDQVQGSTPEFRRVGSRHLTDYSLRRSSPQRGVRETGSSSEALGCAVDAGRHHLPVSAWDRVAQPAGCIRSLADGMDLASASRHRGAWDAIVSMLIVQADAEGLVDRSVSADSTIAHAHQYATNTTRPTGAWIELHESGSRAA